MKVVLDTSVIVSAVLTAQGVCARILDMLADAVFGIYVDDRILAEYDSVLRRPHLHLIPDDTAEVMELIRSVAEPVGPVPLPAQLPDPGDMPFLEVAASAGAILVTGNTRHYPKRSRVGVTVLSPREFIELLRRSP
ncbi:MAG: putative toxin-antitoxin system toxin component, PIN family [Deltaproteobacteria bacterium]|nr:putative toxin-antitoxin system toxin component, PIN family [Deltaproteobacteria bacterium]